MVKIFTTAFFFLTAAMMVVANPLEARQNGCGTDDECVAIYGPNYHCCRAIPVFKCVHLNPGSAC
ncbi:hypothetical protein BJ165DRAFT_1528644 [Panaeolus papilionaceus]|nr:hypothetical protein BJ165DRAFT_1528644 [Panaeolus papilionaceus]